MPKDTERSGFASTTSLSNNLVVTLKSQSNKKIFNKVPYKSRNFGHLWEIFLQFDLHTGQRL